MSVRSKDRRYGSGRLKRHTPLRRKKPLRHKSPHQNEWQIKYEIQRASATYVRCARTGKVMHVDNCDPHHPFGRGNKFILCFVWIVKPWHKWIHQHPNEAFKQGWLQPSYRGLVYNPKHPRPWPKDAELNWPIDVWRDKDCPTNQLTKSKIDVDYDSHERRVVPSEQIWDYGSNSGKEQSSNPVCPDLEEEIKLVAKTV